MIEAAQEISKLLVNGFNFYLTNLEHHLTMKPACTLKSLGLWSVALKTTCQNNVILKIMKTSNPKKLHYS